MHEKLMPTEDIILIEPTYGFDEDYDPMPKELIPQGEGPERLDEEIPFQPDREPGWWNQVYTGGLKPPSFGECGFDPRSGYFLLTFS